jgi:hypothetical protein
MFEKCPLQSADELMPRNSGAFFIPGRGANSFAKAGGDKKWQARSAGHQFIWLPHPRDHRATRQCAEVIPPTPQVFIIEYLEIFSTNSIESPIQ